MADLGSNHPVSPNRKGWIWDGQQWSPPGMATGRGAVAQRTSPALPATPSAAPPRQVIDTMPQPWQPPPPPEVVKHVGSHRTRNLLVAGAALLLLVFGVSRLAGGGVAVAPAPAKPTPAFNNPEGSSPMVVYVTAQLKAQGITLSPPQEEPRINRARAEALALTAAGAPAGTWSEFVHVSDPAGVGVGASGTEAVDTDGWLVILRPAPRLGAQPDPTLSPLDVIVLNGSGVHIEELRVPDDGTILSPGSAVPSPGAGTPASQEQLATPTAAVVAKLRGENLVLTAPRLPAPASPAIEVVRATGMRVAGAGPGDVQAAQVGFGHCISGTAVAPVDEDCWVIWFTQAGSAASPGPRPHWANTIVILNSQGGFQSSYQF